MNLQNVFIKLINTIQHLKHWLRIYSIPLYNICHDSFFINIIPAVYNSIGQHSIKHNKSKAKM